MKRVIAEMAIEAFHLNLTDYKTYTSQGAMVYWFTESFSALKEVSLSPLIIAKDLGSFVKVPETGSPNGKAEEDKKSPNLKHPLLAAVMSEKKSCRNFHGKLIGRLLIGSISCEVRCRLQCIAREAQSSCRPDSGVTYLPTCLETH